MKTNHQNINEKPEQNRREIEERNKQLTELIPTDDDEDIEFPDWLEIDLSE